MKNPRTLHEPAESKILSGPGFLQYEAGNKPHQEAHPLATAYPVVDVGLEQGVYEASHQTHQQPHLYHLDARGARQLVAYPDESGIT